MYTEGQLVILQHVAYRDPCKQAVNYIDILDDPLNEGATDGIAENYVSGSSIGIVHAQGTKLNQEITQGDYEILLTRKL